MNRSKSRNLRFELNENRLCLAAVAFVANEITIQDNFQDAQIEDVDGDGDKDIVAATASGIVWLENQDADFTRINSVSDDRRGLLEVVDVDSDDDVDIIWASPFGELSWFENKNGTFGEANIIETSADRFRSIFVADADGDHDFDLFLTSQFNDDGRVLWFENIDGAGKFSSENTIFDGRWAGSIIGGDYDGDGDVDIISNVWGAFFGIAKFANTGNGLFSSPQLLSEQGFPRSLTDIDNDGDLDLLNIDGNHTVSWHENIDGRGDFGPERFVSDARFSFVSGSGDFQDVDGDGDYDIVTIGESGQYLSWYENKDGMGNFSNMNVVSGNFGVPTVLAAGDLDGDGDLDLVSHSYLSQNITWFENRSVGDSNNDGVFNSSDLVKVFQAGKYEDGVNNNAVFDEGDWNGDGDFTSADLVAAFQAGTFVTASELDLIFSKYSGTVDGRERSNSNGILLH